MQFPATPPIPAERPLLLDNFPPSAEPITERTSDVRRGHRSRLARRKALVQVVAADPASSNIEAAAATPADAPAMLSGGARETASPTLSDLVARHALANGVPVSLAQAVVRIESRGNARASNAGALGLMQIKYGTARAAGFSGGASGLFVADTNLRYGMKVLGEAFRASGGNVCLALMRYQSGHLATHMTSANRAYCNRARAVMAGA